MSVEESDTNPEINAETNAVSNPDPNSTPVATSPPPSSVARAWACLGVPPRELLDRCGRTLGRALASGLDDVMDMMDEVVDLVLLYEVKLLPPEYSRDRRAKERFLREAPAALYARDIARVLAIPGADRDAVILLGVEPNYRCGACLRCENGEYNICRHFGFAGLMGDGGMAERAVVPAYMLHRLPGTKLEKMEADSIRARSPEASTPLKSTCIASISCPACAGK